MATTTERRQMGLDPGATYAAYLVTGDAAQQVAIVSGAQARVMLANSDAPDRLRFERQMGDSTRTTAELQQGDRVKLPGGVVRTVASVERTEHVNYRDEPLYAVMWAEYEHGVWGRGNMAHGEHVWTIA